MPRARAPARLRRCRSPIAFICCRTWPRCWKWCSPSTPKLFARSIRPAVRSWARTAILFSRLPRRRKGSGSWPARATSGARLSTSGCGHSIARVGRETGSALASASIGVPSTGVGAQISCWAWVGSYRCLSGDALRHRHAEPGHAVEHRAGDPGLGLLAGQSSGAEATTDDGLVPEHGGFPERAPAVADRLLPAQASSVLDRPDVLVALSGRGVGARARHGGGARRDDHGLGWVRLVLGDGTIDGFAVVGAIGRERGDGLVI